MLCAARKNNRDFGKFIKKEGIKKKRNENEAKRKKRNKQKKKVTLSTCNTGTL